VSISSTTHTTCLVHSQPFLWQSFTNTKNYETSNIRQSLPSFQSTIFSPAPWTMTSINYVSNAANIQHLKLNVISNHQSLSYLS
jgi:hypothetical protein